MGQTPLSRAPRGVPYHYDIDTIPMEHRMLKSVYQFDSFDRKRIRFESWKIFDFPLVRVLAGNAAAMEKACFFLRR
jgi:hypothetical protein